MDGDPGVQPTGPAQPAQPTQPMKPTQPMQTVPVESLDPTGRPMAQAVPTDESDKKKPKKGLLIGLIVGAVVLISAIVIAVVVAMGSKKPDVVAKAVQRIVNGETPTNLSVKGSVDFLINIDGAPIKQAKVDLDSSIMTNSMINSSSAVLTLTAYNDEDYSVKLNEVYAADGDLYLEVEGIADLVDTSGLIDLLIPSNNTVVDCSTDEDSCTEEPVVDNAEEESICISEEDNCISEKTTVTEQENETTKAMSQIASAIDSVWIKIPLDDLKGIGADYVDQNSPLYCIADTINYFNRNSNNIAGFYNKYPFISSTTKGVTVASKQSQVYLVQFDGENFAGFINSFNGSSDDGGPFACFGVEDGTIIDGSEISNSFEKLPNIYAEVNENNDFSRLYLETALFDESVKMTVDLDFSYPTYVNAPEPIEYTDLSDLSDML